MSEIPQYSLSDFRELKVTDIRNLKSCELIADTEYLCTIIIPPKDGGMTISDYVRTQAMHVAVSGNSVGGQDLEDIPR